MKIRTIHACAVVKRKDGRINANGIFHRADRKFIIVSKDELLIDVTISPSEEKHTAQKRNKPDEKKRVQKKVIPGIQVIDFNLKTKEFHKKEKISPSGVVAKESRQGNAGSSKIKNRKMRGMRG